MDYKEYIAEISTKISILDVIGHYVKLRKQGRNYVGLCPFHHEKTPSFTVSPEKGLFYCFGCKASGDMLSFVRKIHNVSLAEAVEIVSKEFNVELPPWRMSTAASRERQELLQIMKTASAAFAAALQTPQAIACQGYMQKRELDTGIVSRFALGYCPPDIRSFISWCAAHGTDEAALARAGLIQHHGSDLFSPFANRLMFPIWDSIGNIVAFGGRAIDGSMPKYTNSPESPLFAKRRTLYALPLAEHAIRERGVAVVVEGYMDAIALHKADFTNTVASLGTAFTEEQAMLLKRSASRVLLNFDSDEAGQRAAKLALSTADRTGIEVAIVRVTGAKDPDELLREADGRESYQKALDTAIPVGDFLLEGAANGKDMRTIAGKRAFIQEIMESVDTMQDSLLRTQLLTRIAQRVGIREEEIVALYHKEHAYAAPVSGNDPWQLPRRNLGHARMSSTVSLQDPRDLLERSVVHGLIHHLDQLEELKPLLEGLTFQNETYQEIFSILRQEHGAGDTLLSSAVAQLGPEAAALVGRWSLEEYKLSSSGVRDSLVKLRSEEGLPSAKGSTSHERST